MHSMHQVRSLSSGPLIQQQQQLIQQQELGGVPQSQQQEQLSMTVLESLEPVQSGQQQQQQQQAVMHHLGPVQAGPPPIQLHQLQPSSRQLIEQQQQQQQHEIGRQQQEHREELQTNGTSSHQSQPGDCNGRQRQSGGGQLEGIVADGGGPIVQWLLENYEIADGESLPRSTVYNHYLAHCRSLRMSSVNAASFGKLIRSVFVGLKTRRLGTRGHSKYHYFGVRAKQHVRFDWSHEGSNGPEGGRAGCSSASMMRDDTNSNCGSDGAGQCGSETDSTGNCSGRLSTSMSNLANGNHTRGTGATTSSSSNNNTSNNNNNHVPHSQSGSKRLKRLQLSNGSAIADTHHSHNYQEHGEVVGGATLEDLDQQQHLHQNEMHYQNDLSQQQQQLQHQQQVSNGMHDGPVHQINGYDKQELLAYDHEQQWLSPALINSYDLASLRQHLNLERVATLVQESWPEREPGLLESQLRATRLEGKHVATSPVDKSNDDDDDDEQDLEQLIELIEPFEKSYKSHFKRMVELMSELNFAEVERLWCAFWQQSGVQQQQQQQQPHWMSSNLALNDSTTQHQPSSQYADVDEQLTFEQLRRLTGKSAVMERVVEIDRRLFAAFESFLVVDMLSPMPRPLVQQLRAFACNICHWLEAALKEYDVEFVARKLRSARVFEQALRRCTSINHLSAASRAIWSKRAVLAQMSADLSRLDLGDIEHQVATLMDQEKFVGAEPAAVDSLLMADGAPPIEPLERQEANSTTPATMPAIGECAKPQNGTMQNAAEEDIENSYASQRLGQHAVSATVLMQPGQLVQSFLHLLEDPFPASAWPEWCRSLVEARVSGRSLEEASNFILRWNFYISLILRELTLRSAPSLGSFQLIRLLFDEFIYHSVVAKLGHEKSPAQKFNRSHI